MTTNTIRSACAFWSVPIGDILGECRDHKLVVIRAALSYIMKHRDELSYPRIGKLLGGRDHSTIISSMKNVYEFYHVYDDFKAFVDEQMEMPKYGVPHKIVPVFVEVVRELPKEALKKPVRKMHKRSSPQDIYDRRVVEKNVQSSNALLQAILNQRSAAHA